MYGIVVELEIDEQQADRAIDFLHQVVVPMITQRRVRRAGRGCVHVTVTVPERDHLRGRAVADAAVERVRQGPPPGAPTRFVSAEVFEIMAQA